MRQIVSSLLAIGAATLVAGAVQAGPKEQPQPRQVAANDAGRHGAPAEFIGQALDVGYSAAARHIADCLASVPGYDPATDRVRLPSGESRPCKL